MQNDNQNEILDLSHETDEDRKKGKGYTAILANIAAEDISGILRFNSKDYLVLDIIQQEGKEETTYHLKAC